MPQSTLKFGGFKNLWWFAEVCIVLQLCSVFNFAQVCQNLRRFDYSRKKFMEFAIFLCSWQNLLRKKHTKTGNI